MLVPAHCRQPAWKIRAFPDRSLKEQAQNAPFFLGLLATGVCAILDVSFRSWRNPSPNRKPVLLIILHITTLAHNGINEFARNAGNALLN